MPISATDYDFLSSLLLEKSGLSLGVGKEYLLEARLLPLAQTCGLSGFQEMISELRKGTNPGFTKAVMEAMTTNETSFFRDKTPFEDLKSKILPILLQNRTSRILRIWSAASSSGQEPYSLLMMLEDSFPQLKDWVVEVIATDINQKILDRASEGIYSQFEVQRGLPIQTLMKYFKQVPAGWQISEKIRNRCKFRLLNLLDNFQGLGPLDIVLCRNVLIYFEPEMKKTIMERIAKVLRNDGFLILGAAETVLGITDAYKRYKECSSAVYMLSTSPAVART